MPLVFNTTYSSPLARRKHASWRCPYLTLILHKWFHPWTLHCVLYGRGRAGFAILSRPGCGTRITPGQSGPLGVGDRARSRPATAEQPAAPQAMPSVMPLEQHQGTDQWRHTNHDGATLPPRDCPGQQVRARSPLALRFGAATGGLAPFGSAAQCTCI